jgi:hypothetical protein
MGLYSTKLWGLGAFAKHALYKVLPLVVGYRAKNRVF